MFLSITKDNVPLKNLSFLQKDSTIKPLEIDEITITSYKYNHKIKQDAFYTSSINNNDIKKTNFQRISDVLKEENSITINNNFGKAVQMQGLPPDYTLIMIDGEPVVGRYGGTINLDRIASQDVKRIEILRGPHSSLYGSEALAGIINIITKDPKEDNIELGVYRDLYNSYSFNGNITLKNKNFSIVTRNTYYNYDVAPFLIKKDNITQGRYIEPYFTFSNNTKARIHASDKHNILLSTKYYIEQNSNLNKTYYTYESENKYKVNDYTIGIQMYSNLSKKIINTFRFYTEQYEYSNYEKVKQTNQYLYNDAFKQTFIRGENQVEISSTKKHISIIGIGYAHNTLTSNRYQSETLNANPYTYLQHEYLPFDKLSIVGGIRYDINTAFSSSLNPKIGFSYHILKNISFHASYGKGFKNPDFRQAFINYTNNAVGYTLYGANILSTDNLQKELESGAITSILPRAYEVKKLLAETSDGFNLGIKIHLLHSQLGIEVNTFYNFIKNIIQYEPIAIKNNNSYIYSYFNLNNVYTRGGAISVHWRVFQNFEIKTQYQYLESADNDILNAINKGKVYGRELNTNYSVKLSKEDYGGLPYNSKHSGNIKVFYSLPKNKIDYTLRLLYRSKWGILDKDGNNIINREDEYANGYIIVNTSIRKHIKRNLSLTFSVNNLTNYMDIANIPDIQGITWNISINYFFNPFKHKSNQ